MGEFSLTIAATNADGTVSTSVPLAVHRYAAVSSLAWDGLKQGCAVVDGGVQCFGQGFLDATGTSAATASEPMQLIAAGSGATVVAGSPGEYRNGGTHYCAVVNGGVWCWGNNEFGQLGNNSTTNSAVPVNVIPAGSDTVAVSVGAFEDELGQRLAAQSCAVVDGGLQCWGRYEAGPGQESSLTPTWIIARNSGVTALSATYGHTCVVLSGGVQCFGVDRYGETGGGGVFPTGSGATAVATGLGHSCALVAVRVHCWGSNAYGQLGVYTPSDRTSTPVTRYYFPTVTELTAGYLHTCTLEKDSVVSSVQLCWGKSGQSIRGWQYNESFYVYGVSTSLIPGIVGTIINGVPVTSGMLCCSDLAQTRSLVPVQTIPAGNRVQSIAAGDTRTCALADGGIRCWGQYDTTASLAYQPQVSQEVDPGSGATSIFARGPETCAVYNGGVLCGGGLGYPFSYIVAAGGGVTAASLLGGTSSFASWRRPQCYVINGGVGCEVFSNPSSYTLQQTIPAQSSVTQISTYDASGCALALGGVRCWGNNENGQLGDGTTTPRDTPVPTIADGSGVTAVSLSRFRACAVIIGGLQCWGKAVLGDDETYFTPVQVIPSGSGVTAVHVGDNHQCAVISGGVRCWGWNIYGQLGNGTTTNSSVPVQAIQSGAGATDVTVGTYHTCAVVNGGVQCWGSNYWSQLPDPSTSLSSKRYLQLPSAPRIRVLDIDQNQPFGEYSALTDGQIILRYMMGLTGVALTQGALSTNSTRVDPTLVKAYLDFIRAHLDIDGNGTIDAETDGVLLLRYLLGFRGQPLLDGAVSTVGLPTRATAQAIETYLASLMLQ